MTITPKLRQHLKAKAHQLKPVIMIGNNGLTEAVLKETDLALNAHELIKVRIASEDRDEKKSMFKEICDQLNAELVQQIGNIGIVYRKKEE